MRCNVIPLLDMDVRLVSCGFCDTVIPSALRNEQRIPRLCFLCRQIFFDVDGLLVARSVSGNVLGQLDMYLRLGGRNGTLCLRG